MSSHYTHAEREALMQKVQMQMSNKRFQHVLGVEKTAVALAEIYGASPIKASIAALTHDYAKERSDDEFIQVIRQNGFDLDLLHGAADMGLLDKIIYVADYIEPGRNFPGVEEAREIALVDLDKAVAYETKHTLLHLINQEAVIYPKTIETYNHWVANFRRELP